MELGDILRTVIGSKDEGQKGGGIFGSDLWPSLIQAGTSLVGIYANQKEQRKLAEEYAKQRQAELEYAKSQAGGGGGASKATLAQLYAAYANAVGESGTNFAKNANDTAANIIAGMNARAARQL